MPTPQSGGRAGSVVNPGRVEPEPLAVFVSRNRESLQALFTAAPEPNPHSRQAVDAYLAGEKPPPGLHAPGAFLRALDRADRAGDGLLGGHRYFRNDITVDTFITALSDTEAGTGSTAVKALLEHATPEQLQRHSGQLLAAWEAWGFGAAYFDRLITIAAPQVALGLVRKALPERYAVPAEIRARLGDEQAEAQLIGEFRKASDPKAKTKLASLLGFVGTKDAATALAQEMRSPLVIEEVTRRSSIRIVIIEALGYIYPDVDLLNNGLARTFYAIRYPPEVRDGLPPINTAAWREALRAKLESLSREERARIFRPRTHIAEEFYERVEQWCSRELGVTWSSERPPTLLREDKRRIHPTTKP